MSSLFHDVHISVWRRTADQNITLPMHMLTASTEMHAIIYSASHKEREI